MVPDRVDRLELELASLIVACDDDLGHAAVTPEMGIIPGAHRVS
jgi:hypothetical protein